MLPWILFSTILLLTSFRSQLLIKAISTRSPFNSRDPSKAPALPSPVSRLIFANVHSLQTGRPHGPLRSNELLAPMQLSGHSGDLQLRQIIVLRSEVSNRPYQSGGCNFRLCICP